jgi:hypothetical protein
LPRIGFRGTQDLSRRFRCEEKWLMESAEWLIMSHQSGVAEWHLKLEFRSWGGHLLGEIMQVKDKEVCS